MQVFFNIHWLSRYLLWDRFFFLFNRIFQKDNHVATLLLRFNDVLLSVFQKYCIDGRERRISRVKNSHLFLSLHLWLSPDFCLIKKQNIKFSTNSLYIMMVQPYQTQIFFAGRLRQTLEGDSNDIGRLPMGERYREGMIDRRWWESMIDKTWQRDMRRVCIIERV